MSEGDACPQCGGPLAWRAVSGYPVVLQVVFGASFVAFLLLIGRLQGNIPALAGWTCAQALLGWVLVRARLRAKARILRCIRCGVAVA